MWSLIISIMGVKFCFKVRPIENLWISEDISFLQCQSLIEELSASHSTDLQQRAYELQAVISLDAHTIESVMPLDASCEDIEVFLRS